MVIFDEAKYAERIDKEKIKSSRDALRKGTMLAKLYFSQGYTDEQVTEKLEEKFAGVFNDLYDTSVRHLKIRRMISQAKVAPLLHTKPISFSLEEFEFIRHIRDDNQERTMFILMCLSKFYDNSFFFRMAEIQRMIYAKDSKCIREALLLFFKNGYIDITEKRVASNTNHRKIFYSLTNKVLDLHNPDNIIVTIEDYDSVIRYYLNYRDEKTYPKCAICGDLVAYKANKARILCKKCRNADVRERMAKMRANRKAAKQAAQNENDKNVVK